MKIKNGDICPGKSISDLNLGMSYEQVRKMFSDDFQIDTSYVVRVIKLDNAKLWFDENNILCQILVFGDFSGKLKGKIGIGSTLEEVEKQIGPYRYDLGVYVLENQEGICFELKDTDEEDEEDEQEKEIEYIAVFK